MIHSGFMHGIGTLPALIALTKASKDDAMRDAAENAIASVCMKPGSAESGGEAVLTELKQAIDPAERNSWIRILASLGYAKALPVIQAALGDADAAVAANAIEQLGRWPDPPPIDGLLAVAETGANPAQRKRAWGRRSSWRAPRPTNTRARTKSSSRGFNAPIRRRSRSQTDA